jgi:hypothetical protein
MILRNGDWLIDLTGGPVRRVLAPTDGGGDPDPPPEGVTFASTDVLWSDTEITFEEESA